MMQKCRSTRNRQLPACWQNRGVKPEPKGSLGPQKVGDLLSETLGTLVGAGLALMLEARVATFKAIWGCDETVGKFLQSFESLPE